LDWVRIVFTIVVGIIIFLIAYSDLPLFMKTVMILGPLVTLVLVVFGRDILKKIFRADNVKPSENRSLHQKSVDGDWGRGLH